MEGDWPPHLFMVGVDDEMQPITPGLLRTIIPIRRSFEFYLTLPSGDKVILSGDHYTIQLADWDARFLPPNAKRII